MWTRMRPRKDDAEATTGTIHLNPKSTYNTRKSKNAVQKRALPTMAATTPVKAVNPATVRPLAPLEAEALAAELVAEPDAFALEEDLAVVADALALDPLEVAPVGEDIGAVDWPSI